MTQKTFCAEPWKQIFIGPDSGVKTCCSGQVELGNLQKDNIKDILSNNKLLEIKQSILDGKWHPNCTLCKELEEKGIESQRKRTEHEYDNIDFFKANIDYHIPEMIDVRWDNTCNLACNYCMPYFSSVWASIKKEYQVSARDNDGLLEYIREHHNQVKNVLCLGGEPFLQKKNFELMDIIPKNVPVMFLTNLSIDLENNPIFEKLKNRDYVSFGLSFETIGERFEYVRHNASWEKFTHNLQLLKENFPVNRIRAMPLYCIYSAFNLEELYEFIYDEGLTVQWQKIEGPEELNVSLLPDYLKNKAIHEIDRVIEKYEDMERLDIATLIGLRESLSKTSNNIITLDDVQRFHTELETKYHTKKNTFVDLWGHLF